MSIIPEQQWQELADHSRSADEERNWPEFSWQVLQKFGAPRWSIPEAYGGEGLTGVPLLERYEELAGACLTTAFILSQRDAAVRRLRDSGHEVLCGRLLPDLATGKHFTSVGLAQLTTSRQFTKPAVVAVERGEDWIIDGVIPWVTGAPRAEHILIGAAVDEGKQILAFLPTDLAGVTVGRPLDLMALEGSLTTEVRLDGVRLPGDWLLAGPRENVLQISKGNPGGLETSCLALGLAGSAIRHLFHEASLRSDLTPTAQRMDKVRQKLRRELHGLAGGENVAPAAAQWLRARANTLVLQATQAALTASKGTGFLRGHPAQRWARQALFFLVWSCPAPVAAATLSYLTAGGDIPCS